MDMWQYNAWCQAYEERQKDTLILQVQSAYYCAYWSALSDKPKKSLQSVINIIRPPKANSNCEPIDFKEVDKQFRQMEDLRKNGWYKQDSL